MIKRFAATISSAIAALWSSRTTSDVEAAPGTIKYVLVVRYVDEDRDETTRTFGTAAEREAAATGYVTASASIEEDDDGAIASITYDDRLVFWRRSKAKPTIPNSVPVLEGTGNLVLQVRTTGNGTIEVEGISMRKLLQTLATFQERLSMEPREVAVIRRRVAFERRPALLPTK